MTRLPFEHGQCIVFEQEQSIVSEQEPCLLFKWEQGLVIKKGQCAASGKHVTRVPSSSSQARGELLLYFSGTGVEPSDSTQVDFFDHAASLGFHVFAVDYPNWPTVVLSCNEDITCFETVRRQRLWGGGATAEEDAGIVQFKAKLADLAQQDPTQNWGIFLNSFWQIL